MEKERFSKKKQSAFLAAYAECGNITRAAEIAKIERRSHYRWMVDDPEYATAFQYADQQACDRLEQEARRRAVEGTLKPVYHKGEQCGVIREYSDTLLIFLMKGAMPEKYKERVSQEVTGKGGGPIEMDIQRLSDDELHRAITEATAEIAELQKRIAPKDQG